MHSCAPAVCAWPRAEASQPESRQGMATWAMADWLAQAQPWSEAGVQTAAMAEERQGT